MVDLNRTPEQKKRKVPLLVWIIAAILIGWFAIAFFTGGEIDAGAAGDARPETTAQDAYMPAAPAQGDAPAVAGDGAVTPPSEP